MGYLNFTSSAEGTAPTNAHPLAHTEYSQGEVSMGGEQDLPRERAVIVSLTDLRSRTQVFVKFGIKIDDGNGRCVHLLFHPGRVQI